MASSKRIGFFLGEERITLVQYDKNAPLQVTSIPFGAKSNAASPFSSDFSEEIQTTALLQKMIKDNRVAGNPFYVSLPMKEIILRSFVIPFVKPEEIQGAIKFEAKKYLPIDIQDLTFVYYTTPFTDNKVKRLQIIFFAVRKECLDRYERIFKQVNATVDYYEPCMVSLTKVLLFKKEINPTDHLAFLILDKNTGRICFIDQGIPQFIREFSISSGSSPEETNESAEILNLKIVNEVGNSFDFYTRQFGGEKMDQLLVSSESTNQGLLNALETELKLKLRKASPVVTMGGAGQGNNMDSIYAMGVCVEPSLDSLSGFNFIENKRVRKPKFQGDPFEVLKANKDIASVFLICAAILAGAFFFFQTQLKAIKKQYAQIALNQGIYVNVSVDNIQTELKESQDKLASYKNIRTDSAMVLILLRLASHLPQGAYLKELNIVYDRGASNDAQASVGPVDPTVGHVTIQMKGEVLGDDQNGQIETANQVFSDIKNDKELSRFFKRVNLNSLNRESINGKQVTGFTISCF